MPDRGQDEVRSPLHGTVVRIEVEAGAAVGPRTTLVVVESMKMEHPVDAGTSGVVQSIAVAAGDTVEPGDLIAVLVPATATSSTAAAGAATASPGAPTGTPSTTATPSTATPATTEPSTATRSAGRADVRAVAERHARTRDEARPDAIERRRRTRQRTARENVADLVDDGSFVEYGPLVIAAQRRRRTVDDLIERTPADGLVAGVATVDGHPIAVMSYDYTVLAGTQGMQNHRKKDRLIELAERQRLPVVFFTEGGGGRPGDTDALGVSGLDVMAFHLFARLSGLVPLIGIASGKCFAGNAAILGCCDVVIATSNANIGMGGPAMIEGGGLGTYEPEAIGPLDVQRANGVVDIAVADEAEAVDAAKRYLSYFHGRHATWEAADQTALRDVVPENRVRVYDIRTAITTLADTGAVLEIRAGFAPGIITALARVEGHPLGIVANNPAHLGGAIDAAAADKAARFLQLCDAFDVPVLFLCDTPGFMVGPASEEAAAVRHMSRLFVTGANLDVPFMTIVLRKGYGLGAQAMAGGSFKAPLFCIAWPTGEFGGMGLEGAVRLGYRRELDAIDDPAERERTFREMVDRMYEHGKALNTATYFEIDDVIDPADSRRWIASALDAAPARPSSSRRAAKKRPFVDTW